MRAKPLILPKKLLIALNGIAISMMIGIVYRAYHDIEVSIYWLYVAIILCFVPFLAVLVDLILNPIHKKYNWLIYLTLGGVITPLFYLIIREKTLEKSNLTP